MPTTLPLEPHITSQDKAKPPSRCCATKPPRTPNQPSRRAHVAGAARARLAARVCAHLRHHVGPSWVGLPLRGAAACGGPCGSPWVVGLLVFAGSPLVGQPPVVGDCSACGSGLGGGPQARVHRRCSPWGARILLVAPRALRFAVCCGSAPSPLWGLGGVACAWWPHPPGSGVIPGVPGYPLGAVAGRRLVCPRWLGPLRSTVGVALGVWSPNPPGWGRGVPGSRLAVGWPWVPLGSPLAHGQGLLAPSGTHTRGSPRGCPR